MLIDTLLILGVGFGFAGDVDPLDVSRVTGLDALVARGAVLRVRALACIILLVTPDSLLHLGLA